jgi:hypothetical protein
MTARYNAIISGEPQVSVAGLNGIAYDFDYELPDIGKMRTRDISVEVSPRQFFNVI